MAFIKMLDLRPYPVLPFLLPADSFGGKGSHLRLLLFAQPLSGGFSGYSLEVK